MKDAEAMHHSVTRSEEHLAVHTEWRARARYRFGKQIVTEEKVERIPLRREEFFFDEVPISAVERIELSSGLASPRDNPREIAGDIDLILCREELVVTRRVVPYERVRVRRGVSPGLTTIHEQLRREHIDIERSASQGPTAEK